MISKHLPSRCPSCSSLLKVAELSCEECDTRITGSFPLPALIKLDPQDQKFILDFVKSSGSLKQLAKQMELSYPTVRNILDDIIGKLNCKENEEN